jgi:hypothetical protein
MNNMERKRKLLEYERVKMARLELEFKIEERQEEIARLEEAIEKQAQKEKDLQAELAQ